MTVPCERRRSYKSPTASALPFKYAKLCRPVMLARLIQRPPPVVICVRPNTPPLDFARQTLSVLLL